MPTLRKVVIAGFFVLVFCAAVGLAFRKPVPPPGTAVASVPVPQAPPDIPDTKKIAKTKAREFVEASLKAPSTAKFQPTEEFAAKGRQDKKYQYVWDVVGYVDSQNSYGAMLRQNFMVTMQQDGSGGWKLIEMTFY